MVAALILDKIDFKTKSGTKKHKGDYIMIKESIQEDTTLSNIYSIGAPKYIKQILTDIKGEIDNNKVKLWTLTLHLDQWTDHPDRKAATKQWP